MVPEHNPPGTKNRLGSTNVALGTQAGATFYRLFRQNLLPELANKRLEIHAANLDLAV